MNPDAFSLWIPFSEQFVHSCFFFVFFAFLFSCIWALLSNGSSMRGSICGVRLAGA